MSNRVSENRKLSLVPRPSSSPANIIVDKKKITLIMFVGERLGLGMRLV